MEHCRETLGRNNMRMRRGLLIYWSSTLLVIDAVKNWARGSSSGLSLANPIEPLTTG